MLVDYHIQHQGQKVKVERSALARAMDKNQDHLVSDQEIIDYYGIPEDRPGSDRAGRVNENKWHLRAQPNPDAKAYHSADQAAEALLALESRYPDTAQRVCLGHTHEGRPIWALRVTAEVSRDASHKTGVVITGCHHAREWMTVEVPLHSAEQLLKGFAEGDPACRARLEKGEFWFVPVVSPDGLEYSRDVDNMWRKNRVPVATVVDGHPCQTFGVDPNRNYFLPQQPGLYRPDWDKAGITRDDSEGGADQPESNVFRGLAGGSEKEIVAMQELKFGRPNVRGVLDYHSFGEEFLYPFSYTKDAPPDVEVWRSIGQRMIEAAGGQPGMQSSADLYPISGGPLDAQYMHGIVGFEVELNGCFQPAPSQIAPTCQRYHNATMAFADEILARAETGQLPARRRL